MSQNYPVALLHFLPNLRTEPASATTGYTWGKPAVLSNILRGLEATGYTASTLNLDQDTIVAERWLTSDDRALGSQVIDSAGQIVGSFWELLEESGAEILGEQHFQAYGPFLGCIMKQLDTNAVPTKGSLSVQVHPKPGHPTRPAKPEMWQGSGHIYLGWQHEVTPAEIQAAYEAGTLEQLMNAITLSPEKLILVGGGMIHAIRYDTFTAEWSMAPGAADIGKGNLKDATVSPYDRTDGKTPRPGKEDLAGTLSLLSEYENGFKASSEASLLTQPLVLDQVKNQYERVALFRTPEVWVDQIKVAGMYELDLSMRGLPLFIKSGQVVVSHQGQGLETLVAGQEVFVPHSLGKVQLTALAPTVLQLWYQPLPTEQTI